MKPRFVGTEKRLVIKGRGIRGVRGRVKWVRKIKKYKLPVVKY